MENNLVSICITTYNRKKLLPSTLRSVLSQTYKNIEIFIIDDCSNDGTKELIENKLLKLDKRIRYIRHRANKGLAASRNSAIFNAKGKYFTFCDDDDQLLPNFVEKFVKVAETYDNSWCFCCGGKYKVNKKVIKHIYNEKNLMLKKAIENGYTPPVAGQFYHTDVLKKVRGYNEIIKSGVDHDLWLTLSYNNISVCFLSSPLAMPNSNQSFERMTNNFYKRSFLIEKSLKIWKKNFQITYGKLAYKNFCSQYRFDIFKSFLIQFIKNKNFKEMFKLIFYQKNIFFLPRVVKYILIRLWNKIQNLVIIKPSFSVN